MPPKTQHFSPALFKFLKQLKKNNDREWFNANKQRYIEDVRDPMLRFIEDFQPRLRAISRHLVADPSTTGGSMFRIHRDTRFSKDKTPYKTACTARFQHDAGKDVHTPGYYIHLGADGVYMGAGLWHPDTKTAGRVRDAIVARAADWKRAVGGKAFQDGTLKMEGETLKRPPRGYDADHPLIEDIKRKDFVCFAQLDEKMACAPGFIDTYTNLCKSSKGLVKFIVDALGLEW